MADYYAQYCFVITELTPTERKWFEEAVDFLERYRDEDEAITEEVFEASPFKDCCPDDVYDFTSDITWEDTEVWFSSEYGGMESFVPLLQQFLKNFRPTEWLGFEWAYSCSKPRADAFGGGAVFISADHVEWMNTGAWLGDMAKHFGPKPSVP